MLEKQEYRKDTRLHKKKNRESQRAEGVPGIGRSTQGKGDRAGEGPWKAEQCLVFLIACLGFPVG